MKHFMWRLYILSEKANGVLQTLCIFFDNPSIIVASNLKYLHFKKEFQEWWLHISEHSALPCFSYFKICYLFFNKYIKKI